MKKIKIFIHWNKSFIRISNKILYNNNFRISLNILFLFVFTLSLFPFRSLYTSNIISLSYHSVNLSSVLCTVYTASQSHQQKHISKILIPLRITDAPSSFSIFTVTWTSIIFQFIDEKSQICSFILFCSWFSHNLLPWTLF